MLSFLKKKKEKEYFREVFSEDGDKKIKKLEFTKKEKNRFFELVKKYKNVKLYGFHSFIEKIEIILINNQFKMGYNIKKALNELDNGKYPVYKKISFISNINLINHYLTEDYIKYNFLFENLDLLKIIHNIQLVRKDFNMKGKYELTTRKALTGFNGISSIFVQFILIMIASQMIIYPVIMDKMYNLNDVKLFERLSAIDQIGMNLFGGLFYVGDNILLGYLGIFFLLSFLFITTGFIGSIIKVMFLNKSIYNKREIDKTANEISFSGIVLKNIKNLEIGHDTGEYQYVNFKDFIIKCGLEAHNRGLVNDLFLSDFSFLFQFFFQFGELHKGRKFNLTEGFINILEDVLISYKTSLSGSGNFNLGQVYERFKKYQDNVGYPIFEKNFMDISVKLSTTIMISMSLGVVINMFVSVLQSNSMKMLVGGM